MRPRTLALISVFLILSSMISLACNEPTPTPPNLALLDGETGEVIWSVRAPGDYVGQSFPGAGLVLLEGMQVCSGEPVERLVLDGATGESIWESLKPFLGSDGVQMANWDRDKGSLTMRALPDGQVHWTQTFPDARTDEESEGAATRDLSWWGDLVIFSHTGLGSIAYVYALDRWSGEVRFELQFEDAIHVRAGVPSGAPGDSVILSVDGNGAPSRIAKVDAESGQLHWVNLLVDEDLEPYLDYGEGEVLTTSKALFLLRDGGEEGPVLEAWDLEDGALQWRAALISKVALAPEAGGLFVLHHDGIRGAQLRALDEESGEILWAAPLEEKPEDLVLTQSKIWLSFVGGAIEARTREGGALLWRVEPEMMVHGVDALQPLGANLLVFARADSSVCD